ncbi:TetR/AcrR family transcriptional regulator [Ottowia sp. GY511]|uniref:TetR/AcrR family transcriptional regulator n=1 Tax=Ottowia flava TaxID=2675430 RepID=A0ABW4KXC7_9BURK|nr:TetR/AcrR family transcriptional regulator [Ottowia sp. GY511]TXK31503.1 TetR/AcrR family transcriptional regulator [Ottowia sp. GY511]
MPAKPAAHAQRRAADAAAQRTEAARGQPAEAQAAAARAPRPYHHGNLREALIEAAVAIIDEQGVEQLSVRETAKRAGVSPGAPFRHFASRAALLTAVAEQATERLAASATQALAAAAGQPPLQRLAAIGHAYLDWASAYPTHFRVISDRTQLDGGGSPATAAANEGLRRQMRSLLDEALGTHVSAAEREHALVASRAMVYGLARMAADGHFPEWQLPQTDTPATLHGVLDFFIASLAQRARDG